MNAERLQRTSDDEQQPSCIAILLFVAVSLWIILATFLIHIIAWTTAQFLLYEETPLPWFAWLLISWAHGLALAVPVGLLALFTRASRLRAAYQMWTLASAFVFAIAFARVFPTTQTQPAEAAQIAITSMATAVLWLFVRRRGHISAAVPPNATLFAAALAAILLVPSLSWGALGSRLDTLLNLLASLSFGCFAGVLLDGCYLRPLAARPLRTGHAILFDGWIAALTLLILGSGFGFDGSQLLLMIALPPLGFISAALAQMHRVPRARAKEGQSGGAWLPIAALVGITTAGPLMLFDPDELTIILDPNPLGSEILGWAVRAMSAAFALACLCGLVLLLIRAQRAPRLTLALPLLVGAWLAAIGVYVFFGHPGFFGEQMFVILKDQADLSQAYSIADRNERTRFVYDTLTQHANRTQANLRAMLDQARAGYVPHYLVNALEVNGGPLLRVSLLQQPEVDRILDSPHLRPLPASIPVSTGDQRPPTQPDWNLTLIGADRVWNELHVTGKGIVVGQSDSGVDGAHPALRDGYRGRGGQDDYNWLDPWNHTRTPTDSGGHGTHTLGSILGRSNIGVAPEAEWFACVNLARNLANPPLYLTCMQFMLAPWPQNGDPLTDGDPTKGAHVINDSWGCPPLEGCDANALAPAASALRAAGIFVVASAGNEGPRCGSVSDPLAIYPDVFSVGAMDRRGTVAFFSSRGPVLVDGSNRIKPDLIAPGVDVLSSFPGNTYAVESGTSMAGPHVVGVVALIWSAQPKLIGDIERTRQILIQTARPYTGERQGCFTGGAPASGPGHPPQDFVPNNGVGYGIVNAYAAVQAALQAP